MVKKKKEEFANPAGIRKYEPTEDTRLLVSRLPHPVTVAYNGQALIVPPRGRQRIDNYRLLGAVPGGVFIINAK